MLNKFSMNYFLHFFMTLVFSLLGSCSLWSMEKNFVLIREIRQEIWRYLSLEDLLVVRQVCRGFDAEVEHLPLKYKATDESFSTFFMRNRSVDKAINMGDMDYPSLCEMVSDQTFYKYESHLLKHLELVTIETFKDKIKNAKDLALLLSGYFVFNFCVPLKAFGIDDKKTENTWYAAKEAAYPISGYGGFNCFGYEHRNIIWHRAQDDAFVAAAKIIEDNPIIVLFPYMEENLKTLYMLAYISQNDFLKYSESAFKAAREDKDGYFNKTKEEVIAQWGKYTWVKEPNNPYLRSVKNIVAALNQFINE